MGSSALLSSDGIGGLPVVEIRDLNSSPLDMCVGLDHYACGYQMGRFLIGRGYRRLGYVGTSHDIANAATARLQGYAKAVADGGGTVARQLCLHDTATFYPGYYGAEQLLASGCEPECIFFQNDPMAFGGLQYCQRAALHVPADVGIAGWGDMPVASVLRHRLTSMRVSTLKLGRITAEMLVGRLSGEPVEPIRDVGYALIPGATIRPEFAAPARRAQAPITRRGPAAASRARPDPTRGRP